MALEALIFDVDGTLAETEEAHRAAFNAAFREWGLDWHWDRPLYARLLAVTGGKERLAHYLSEYFSDTTPPLAPQDIPALHRRKTEIYGEMARSGTISFRPGVFRLIREAQENGLILAIATTTNLAPLEALFAGAEAQAIYDAFSVVAAGDMVTHKKPAPDVYHLALEKLGLSAEHCLALEDSRNGLVAARAAGLATIITPSAYTAQEDFSEALAIVSDLGEPETPYRPLGGLAQEPGVVDIATLKTWHAQANRAASA